MAAANQDGSTDAAQALKPIPAVPDVSTATSPPVPVPPTEPSHKPGRGRHVWFILAVVGAGLLSLVYLIPEVHSVLTTVSTDDAYVNGHVTFVAPRVAGQVTRVLVDDNNRVRKGDLLVQLDKEPYEVQVRIRQAAVATAEADLTAARAQVRGQVAQARSNRFKLEHAMEDVRNQVALLKSNVARLKAEQADLVLAEIDFARFQALVGKGAVSQQQVDTQQATLDVARSRVHAADETVQQTRAGLGLAVNHDNPLDVPTDLDQTFSTVRQVLADLLQSAALFGYTPTTWDATPGKAIADFYKQDPQGNLDHIFEQIVVSAPVVKQAEAKVQQIRRELADAELNLRYCDVVSEIDGVVTRRNVNPGNNVQAGQSLMAVRSLTEIWVDANFKETQLAYLRIGQRVDMEVDMYGRSEYIPGPHHGLYHGHRFDVGAAAGPERHGQLHQGGSAVACAD